MKPPTIALVDYGAGNLRSVTRALETSGAAVRVIRDAREMALAHAIVIPGVGHFGSTRVLDDPWRDALRTNLDRGAVLFGICLGMQWLFDASDEAPDLRGFAAFPGTCKRLSAVDGLKVPHVGWNTMTLTQPSPWLDGVPDGTSFYFTHGYAPPLSSDTCGTTSHGPAFASVAARGRVAGVQFHPEKSGEAGLRILRNLVDIAKETSC